MFTFLQDHILNEAVIWRRISIPGHTARMERDRKRRLDSSTKSDDSEALPTRFERSVVHQVGLPDGFVQR